ncbi:MAG: hypothetical protein ABJA02_16860 [Acidobacteriota bacterium]
MRRLILATVLAASTAAFGACSGAPAVNNTPVKPISTPAPVVTASPVATPVVSPTIDPKASPVKPGTTPEVKKTEKLDDKAKDVKPAATETPKK